MTAIESLVEQGSDNVFADLGLPEADADAHRMKAELVNHLDAIVRQRSLTQTETAHMLGLSQPDVSRLLRGSFREYSLERLLRLLTRLGRAIDIVSRSPRSDEAAAKVCGIDAGVVHDWRSRLAREPTVRSK